MDKKQREVRRQQEDIALQRGLLWVLGAVILEGLLILVNRYYINYRVSEVETAYVFHYTLRFLRVAAPIAALAGLIWTGWKVRGKQSFTLPLVLSIACGAVGLCAHIAVSMQENGVAMLFWMVIAWAVLALVFYLYQREFFLAAAGAGMSILGLWFLRYQGGLRLESGLLLLAIAALLGASVWMKGHGGRLPGAEHIQFLPQKADYGPVLASCGAGLAVMLVGAAAGATAAYYLIYLMLAWLFALFVYYTVKLM